jgi:hypothetical protein
MSVAFQMLRSALSLTGGRERNGGLPDFGSKAHFGSFAMGRAGFDRRKRRAGTVGRPAARHDDVPPRLIFVSPPERRGCSPRPT